jgi:hypothetical protein
VSHHPNRSIVSRRASRAFIPEANSLAPRRMRSHRSTSGHYSLPPFRPSARSRVPTMPSADFCGAVREDCSPLSPPRGHSADLPRSAVLPSVPRRRMYNVRPACGWRTLGSRAHSSRAYHTSYPVRVPRPARSFHAAFRPRLTATPWRFPGPSAPRIPGRGTFTPEPDRMHGTHASGSAARAFCESAGTGWLALSSEWGDVSTAAGGYLLAEPPQLRTTVQDRESSHPSIWPPVLGQNIPEGMRSYRQPHGGTRRTLGGKCGRWP